MSDEPERRVHTTRQRLDADATALMGCALLTLAGGAALLLLLAGYALAKIL